MEGAYEIGRGPLARRVWTKVRVQCFAGDGLHARTCKHSCSHLEWLAAVCKRYAAQKKGPNPGDMTVGMSH